MNVFRDREDGIKIWVVSPTGTVLYPGPVKRHRGEPGHTRDTDRVNDTAGSQETHESHDMWSPPCKGPPEPCIGAIDWSPVYHAVYCPVSERGETCGLVQVEKGSGNAGLAMGCGFDKSSH